MAKLYIPFINPIKYHELAPAQLPQYLSKSIERYPYLETIEEWEENISYPQLFQQSDTINQQLVTSYGPVNQKIIDADGRIYLNESFNQVIQNQQDTSEWVYENETALIALPKGYYFIKLTIGTTSPTILVSEPVFICTKIPYSVLLEYKHREYYGDVFFQTGISFSLRVLGKIKLKTPASKDTIYEDQPLNETLIWSYPYDVYDFLVGGSWGIPDYLIKRLNRVFGCSILSIDGTLYTKNEGAKWEDKSFDGYPLRGWTIELRETLGGRGSQVYENNALQERRVSIIATINTDGFAAGGGSELPLEDFG